MSSVEKEINEKLIRVIKTLEARSDSNQTLKAVAAKLNPIVEKLRKSGEISIYSRDYVEKYTEVFEKISEFEKIVDRYSKGEATLEDLYVSYERLEESLKELLKTKGKLLLREKFTINIPIGVALAFYIFDYISYSYSTNATSNVLFHLFYSTIIALALASLIMVSKRVVLAYIILTLSSVIGLVYATMFLSAFQSISLYLMLTFVSIIYLNIGRIQSSAEYREKIYELFKNIINLIDRSRHESKTEDAVEEDKLWNEALSIFRSIYSDRAEELLRFKVETMIMNGLNKLDALKRVIETYKKTIE